ncbi:MAG: tetratricopeptide repeat-containing protein [Candidatus Dormibacteraeota bacterium]|nr:tetratricopeptide repeat-containing protein [Candidatus Dormibacteraeota bacterium]
MDPSTAIDPITAAIATGAAAGLTGVATQAVRDGYEALKSGLRARFPKIDVGSLEERPSSQAKQASLAEDLEEAGADRDPELLQLARALVEVIEREAPQAATSAGVDLEHVRAEVHQHRGCERRDEWRTRPGLGDQGRRQHSWRLRRAGPKPLRAAGAAPDRTGDPSQRALVDLDDLRAGRDINVSLGSAPAARALPPEPRAGIPPDLIEHFTDREAELAELWAQLQRSRRVVIHGLGGVGKTQLAICYLDQHRADYPDGCFWLRADQATSLIGDLASLAWRLRLPERELPEQELQIEAVLHWLREHNRWLLVADSLDRPVVETMRHWLPPGLPGHFVITSRTALGAARLGLTPLPLEVAISFLCTRTGQADTAGAAAIAETVGSLPLALEQAGAYLIENHWHSPGNYAELLQVRMAELLREGKPEDYPLPVATTWELSFERLEQEQQAAADLLRLCAFLAPDDIPIAILQAAAGELPDRLRATVEDEISFDKAIGALRDYSLLERQQDGLRVHRLVQWVVRESLDAGQREQWQNTSLRVLASAFPDEAEDHPERWPLCGRLLPHAQVVIRRLGDEEPELRTLLMDMVARYLQGRGQYALARPLYERVLDISEQVLGADHPDTATSLNNLAALLHDQGELATARSLHERALDIRERVLGADHPSTAKSLNNLAALLRGQGELATARQLYERALDIRERVLGPDHPDTATSLHNLAAVLWDQGDLASARPLYERALDIRQRVLGADHPSTASSLNDLASLLQTQGEPAAARPLFERALAIRERVLGPDHPDTAASLNNLADLVEQTGDSGDAQWLRE